MELKALDPIERDSDIVYLLNESYREMKKKLKENSNMKFEKSNKHLIVQEYIGNGKVYVLCKKTKQAFLHLVKVPCKYNLKCRGCLATI